MKRFALTMILLAVMVCTVSASENQVYGRSYDHYTDDGILLTLSFSDHSGWLGVVTIYLETEFAGMRFYFWYQNEQGANIVNIAGIGMLELWDNQLIYVPAGMVFYEQQWGYCQ